MMREQHPLDPLHTDLAEMVQHAAIAEVNQQRRLAIADDVDVAGVGPGEQVRMPLGIGLGEATGRGEHLRCKEERKSSGTEQSAAGQSGAR
jgi:hypothetical protein